MSLSESSPAFASRSRRALLAPFSIALLILAGGASDGFAQSRLKESPRYERYEKLARERGNAFKSGSLAVKWGEDGKKLTYSRDGKKYRYDLADRRAVEITEPTTNAPAASASEKPKEPRGTPPARGRQWTNAVSPDGKWESVYRDRNVWLVSLAETNEFAITKDGSDSSRVKYGSACWVYGEELEQKTAMWWPSNSQQVAFYRFDESKVPDYYLALGQTALQDRLDVEPYTKAGGTNPLVDLFIYDLQTSNTVRVDVRDGKPFDNQEVGHYVYAVSWSHNSKELLFHRTNRRQNILELCAANPETGKCRVILREEWLPSYVENTPPMRFLADGRRFLWTSERNGWRNLYLYDLERGLIATLTSHPFEVTDVAHVDEAAQLVYYTARDGANPMKLQLHRVGLDGRGGKRLTDPFFHHTITFAPDGKHFVDVAQTHDLPPVTRLMDAEGNLLDTLATSDLTRFHKLGLKQVELFSFKAADGVTDLYGMLHYPSDFNPRKKYPLLISVYGGPGTGGAHETFTMPSKLTELGFLLATLDSRSVNGRGKHFSDGFYQNFGTIEIDDQAAGVKALAKRPYVDGARVGIYGTSYGGTASAMCLLRYPDVFKAACSCSAVTDFRNYDSIYTERYLWIPQEAPRVYDNASVLTYADKLRGDLMIFYGTADDNVHPSNSMQFIQALQKAGKSFEVQVGPDQGHAGVNEERMMEFFIRALHR